MSYNIHTIDAIPAIDDDATATSVKISARARLELPPYLAQGKATIGWLYFLPNLGAFSAARITTCSARCFMSTTTAEQSASEHRTGEYGSLSA